MEKEIIKIVPFKIPEDKYGFFMELVSQLGLEVSVYSSHSFSLQREMPFDFISNL